MDGSKPRKSALLIGSVVMAVLVVSAISPVPDVPRVAEAASFTLDPQCTYEGGSSGDLVATIASDQGLGGNIDSHYDTGGCMLVSDAVDDEWCVYAQTRAGAAGTDLGELTLDAISDRMAIRSADVQNGTESPPNCNLRELPLNELDDPTDVQINVSLVDDVYGTDVGGHICTDVDWDGNEVACQDVGDARRHFCGAGTQIASIDLTEVDALVVFTDGPEGQSANCDPTLAPTSTSGGIFNDAAGVYLTLNG